MKEFFNNFLLFFLTIFSHSYRCAAVQTTGHKKLNALFLACLSNQWYSTKYNDAPDTVQTGGYYE